MGYRALGHRRNERDRTAWALERPGFAAFRVDERPERGKVSGQMRTVQCVKLGQESEGLEKAPFKGELGQRVFDTVSKTAWRQWLEHSKMLINEYRLDVTSESGQRVWMTELEKFFWGEGAAAPPDFVAPKS